MKKFTIGQNLLVVYGVIIIICVLKTGFNIMFGLSWVAYPSLWLLKDSQSVITFLAGIIGHSGVIILAVIIQGAILYFGGNLLGKLLKK